MRHRFVRKYPAAHVRWTLRVQLWLVTILTVIIFNARSSLSAQSAILLSPAWLQLEASPEALVHSRTNQKPQPRLSSANSGPASSHGDIAQATAPSSHAPSEARSLAKEGERAQRSVAERARGGGLSTPNGKTLTASQYQYDPRGHLIRQIFSSGETLDRQSDPAGNLFRSQDKTDRHYGPGGVIQQANGTQYTVDPDGFLTKKVLSDGATWHYLWSPQGELTQVTRPDGKTVTFTYDTFGRRTSKTYDDKITEYIWDGDDLIHERTTDNKSGQSSPLTTWIQEPGTFTPLAKIEGRKRYGIVSDHLGSPTLLATEAGRVAWQAQLDIYGVPREEGAAVRPEDKTDNPWRFPGQYEDAETGLYYNRFRYYDPELGRYLSEDPIGLLGGEALYGYVHEPLGWWDPFGLTGTYFFSDGTTSYIGKGPYDRMLQSMKERIGGSDNAKNWAHIDFGDNNMGLMVEQWLIDKYNAVDSSTFANSIHSKGRKLLDGLENEAIKEEVKKNALKVERKFKASCK
jgi:RHS repeat-associated protein